MRVPCLMALTMVGLCSAAADESKHIQELVDSARQLRSIIQEDPYRPTYHFVSPEGMAMPFDPNGALFWKGRYHLGYLYQKNVDGVKRDVWGHAVSADLLRWTIYPNMIDVSERDIEEGAYSGGTFLSKDNVPHIIYYGKGASANLIAYATDEELKVWKKLDTNPVLKSLDPSQPIGNVCCVAPDAEYSVFDPDAWYDAATDYYYQITGGMKPGLFKSKDLQVWQYLGIAVAGDTSARYPFEDLSCPEFFPIGNKFMILFISHALGAQYYIGTFENERFTAEQHGRMNWPGGTFFAPEQLRDDKGRNIMWAWVTQPGPGPGAKDYGWSGIMSLPRVLSLDRAGELQINPPVEIELIRLNEVRTADTVISPNQEVTLPTHGKSMEVSLEIAGGTESPFGVKVFASPDGREETVIRYQPRTQELVVDFKKSSASGPVSRGVVGVTSKSVYEPVIEYVSEQRAPLKLKRGEPLKLDIFLDRSIIEVFANGRQAVTQMVYPQLESSTGVRVFSAGERISVKNARIWEMMATNPY